MMLVCISCIFAKALTLTSEDGLVDTEGVANDGNHTVS